MTIYYGAHTGIVLNSGFFVKNPVTIAANGSISANAGYNGDAVYAANYVWSITNYGTLAGSGTASDGVQLNRGGSVVNGSPAATGALIEGAVAGVSISGTLGTIANFGTIEGTGTSGVGVQLNSGGSIANLGTIVAMSPTGAAIGVLGGANFSNGAVGSTAALIQGGLSGKFASVTNYGTITGGTGIHLSASLSNHGLISTTGTAGQAIFGYGNIYNYGTIISSGPGSDGISLYSYGTVVNGGSNTTAALIQGVSVGLLLGGSGATNYGTIESSGIAVASPFPFLPSNLTLKNLGTIEGGTLGVISGGGVAVVNGASASGTSGNTTALIEATGTAVVVAPGTILGSPSRQYRGGTVSNYGSIVSQGTSGVGVSLGSPPLLNSMPGLIMNQGLIEGNTAIASGSAAVTNRGLIQGSDTGISGAGALYNFGTITATMAAVDLTTLFATFLVVNSVVNYGTIQSSNMGITVANSATIAVGYYAHMLGVKVTPFWGTVTNVGGISAASAGIVLNSGGVVINGDSASAAAIIEAQGTAVSISPGFFYRPLAGTNEMVGTVINYGTMASTTGVAVSAPSGLVRNFGTIQGAGTAVVTGALVMYPGAVVSGTAVSGSLILAAGPGTGTITGLGSSFTAGGQSVGGQANWRLIGGNILSLFDSGTLSNAGSASGTINLNGVLTNEVGASFVNASITGSGTLVNLGTIQGDGSFAASLSGLVTNAAGGTIFGGVELVGGGTVTNAGTVANSGLFGVRLDAGGIVVNGGGDATYATISGGSYGISESNTATLATITNYGTISGILLAGGGSVSNIGSGVISGAAYIGVGIFGAAGTIGNTGTIQDNSGTLAFGVRLGAGGTITNGQSGSSAGLIAGSTYGIYLTGTAAAAVRNFGVVSGNIGVAITGTAADTVTNFGTIIGTDGTAVRLGGSDLLVLEPGFSLGGGIANLSREDVIDLAGQTATGLVYTGGTLTVRNGGTSVATLAVPGAFTTASFRLAADGAGGTGISLAPAPYDLNGDGKSDIVLQNTNGQIFLYEMPGANVTGGGYVGNFGAIWQVAAVGDLNADGNADLVLQDNGSGQIYALEMDGSTVVGSGNIGNFGSDWQVKGIGNFGGANADLVLQNTDGQIFVLAMNGNAVVGGGNVGNFGSGWLVATVSVDNADLVLQNTDGQIFVLEMNGTGVAGSFNIGNYGADWHVKGMGAFGGADTNDLLLQNTDGQIYVLQLSGAAVTGGGNIGNYGSDWQAEAVADYYGNGVSDIALQNTSGQIYLLEASGGSVTGNGNVGNPGSTWHMRATG